MSNPDKYSGWWKSEEYDFEKGGDDKDKDKHEGSLYVLLSGGCASASIQEFI